MTSLPIIQKRNLWFSISLVVILAGFFLMGNSAIKQEPFLNFGIDFTGGSSFMLKMTDETVQHQGSLTIIQSAREILNSFGLEKSQIQVTKDQELIIRTQELQTEDRLQMISALEARLGHLELLEVDIIGPTIGAELREQSLWIILFVTLALLIYISWRFEFKYGVSALAAVLHDALVILSFSAILNIEINTAFVAALLTILGYSINDTIVIFDRIREYSEKEGDIFSIDVMNRAVRSMLGRSFHTSMTTLLVVGSLFLFGGTTIKAFCLILLIGIVSGTYSSICVASPVLFLLNKESSS